MHIKKIAKKSSAPIEITVYIALAFIKTTICCGQSWGGIMARVSLQTAAGSEIRPAQVVKRDGSLKPFDATKIRSALARAGAATGEFADETAARLTSRVI